jgi:hypothetical protein
VSPDLAATAHGRCDGPQRDDLWPASAWTLPTGVASALSSLADVAFAAAIAVAVLKYRL